MKARMLFYDRRKGWGRAKADEVEKEIFVHINDVTSSRRYLLEGEEIAFDLLTTPKGCQAKNVSIINESERFLGTVQKFSSGYGFITVTDTKETVFAHYSQIIGGGYRILEEGEPVEFSIEDGEKGKLAVQILRLDTRSPLERFARLDDFDRQIDELAALAQKEDWDYLRTKSGRPYPVLYSYIQYTFRRLEAEGKIAFANTSPSRRIACFNTGLVTEMQEEIYAYFEDIIQNNDMDQNWYLKSFCKQSERRLSHFAELPDIASYFNSSTQLVYDIGLHLSVDYEHIIKDNRSRFPAEIASNAYAARMALEGALKSAIKRVRRNYKTAVPQFYRGEIQLLLPLCLSSPKQADLALVVEKENEIYRASTVLTLDMAYNNARLLARPDREWLDP